MEPFLLPVSQSSLHSLFLPQMFYADYDTVNTKTTAVTGQRSISYHTAVFPGSPGNIAVRCCRHGVRRLAEGTCLSSGRLLAGIPRPGAGWIGAGVRAGGARPTGRCLVRSKPGVYSLRPGGHRQRGDRYSAFSGTVTEIYNTSRRILPDILSLSQEFWQIYPASLRNPGRYPQPHLFPPFPLVILNFCDHSKSCSTFVALQLGSISML